MALQLPPACPIKPQAVSNKTPTMSTVLVTAGVNWQLSVLTTQAQAVSLGVGGSVVDAKNVEFSDGHAGKVVEPASLCEGVLGADTLLYWALRVLKSLLGVTVLPSAEMLTIPKEPAEDVAGK